MAEQGVLSRIVGFVKWLVSTPAPIDERGRCPVCGRSVQVTGNRITGKGGPWRVPRPVEELVGACSSQNETNHTQEELEAARAEKPWR